MLDLTKILKNVPKGTKLYSPIYGDVLFEKIDDSVTHCIKVKLHDAGDTASFTKDGRYNDSYKDGECMLFPSKKQRDWNKFKIDLPIDTPVMTNNGGLCWTLGYYAGNNKTYYKSKESTSKLHTNKWVNIVPFDKFNPNDIEESLKYNIVNN